MDNRPKTIICDIDGCIFRRRGDITQAHLIDLELLPGVKEKWIEWDRAGYNIILMTGRRESTRSHTCAQLARAGIFYDQLIMGVGGGPRVLINDYKPNSKKPTAIAVNLKRDEGMENVKD